MTAVALVCALLCAQTAPLGPTALVAPGLRTHVYVPEDLDPNLLARLARPGVTLWVRTRSNTLRESLLEKLALFPRAYVQMRLPLSPGNLAQLGRLPNVGVWLEASSLPFQPGALGPRPLAWQSSGAWTREVSETVERLRPRVVIWEPTVVPSAAEWAAFAQSRGTKVLRPSLGARWDWTSCEANPLRSLTRVTVVIPWTQKVDRELPMCGVASRLDVPLSVEPSSIAHLIDADPAVEFELDVENGREQVLRAASFLMALAPARAAP